MHAQADRFHRTGVALRRKMWWQHKKMWLIVILIVLILALVIFLSVCLLHRLHAQLL